MARESRLAPEERLLLECCRVEVLPDGAERAAALIAEDLDWDYVVEASIRHAVAPLLKHGLDQVASLQGLDGRVPQRVLDDLGELHLGSARRNRRLYEAIGDVVAALRRGGVEAVGLKDVQLAMQVYPDPALRPMGDVDLLIRREDYDTVSACLGGLGFKPRPSADVPYTLEYAPAQHFRRASDEIWIDVQWNVMAREWDLYGEGRFTWDGPAMFERAVPMTVGDYTLRVPTLEDMLFHLVLHLEGHGYCELVLFCDIAELLRRRGEELRWDEFLEITRRYHAESSVYSVLLLTERLLGAPVPAEILRALEPPYFHGALLGPLFGNLTPLHLSLDEIRLAVSPPQSLLDEFERVPRRQAARAMRLDSEIDSLATSFLAGGGRLIVFDGQPSPRLFPDASLPAFEPLDAFVLADDLALLEDALESAGFVGGRKAMQISSRDPVLAGQETSVTLAVEISSDVGAVLAPGAADRTNAGSALRSLRDRVTGSAPDDRHAVARLVVHALPSEELAVCLATRVGLAAEDRLFRACGLLELARKLPKAPDAARVAEVSARHGVDEPVSAGLAIAASLGGQAPPPPIDDHRLVPPRVLEWARYGPSSVRRYPWLRSAYYYAFSLLALPRSGDRLRYLGRSAVGKGGTRAVLPSLARQVGQGVVQSLGRTKHSLRDFAYWVEPETAERLAVGDARDSLS